MFKFILIFGLTSVLSACGGHDKRSTKTSKGFAALKEDKFIEADTIISPEDKARQLKETRSSVDEFIQLFDENKNAIQSYLHRSSSWDHLDSLSRAESLDPDRHTHLPCDSVTEIRSIRLNPTEQPRSDSVQCLFSQSTPGLLHKIVYLPNEGGHRGDEIIWVIQNKETNTQSQLTLMSDYGREGYTLAIRSEIITPSQVRRTISEEIGWAIDALPAPSATTTQLIEINREGDFIILESGIDYLYFDEYLEEAE